jgi:hypothetical protein
MEKGMEMVDEFILVCLNDITWAQGKPCVDGGRCWCGWPEVKPRTRNHSAVCYELRKYFKAQNKEE